MSFAKKINDREVLAELYLRYGTNNIYTKDRKQLK